MASCNNYLRIMASVKKFKSAVVKIRDILRGPGVSITGMDSMRHICLYLLSRYMTREKVAALEVPDDFAWETLIDTAQTKNGGVQKALDCFYHPEEDCLVRHFDRLFGTDNFSFNIKMPKKHKEILEILNEVNIEDVDYHMDLLGWVYEQHLKTGAAGGGQRDTGQYFTDRSVCEYMTELCKPHFKRHGVPESVCDPAMGTGGFLTAFIKYFKNHHAENPIDWSVQQKEIHGCDTDPKVAAVARINLFMETGGIRSTNLLTHDSLYGDLTQTGYDIILANMPFGINGIEYTECCERVKALKICGTASEPLFLQLMMVSLNLGGRCAVVVPDGMLVNSSSCHNDTRKYLLDNFELKRVIKMNRGRKGKAKFFMNTSIQTSILFFEKTGKPTEVVEFWEVVKDEKGEITETMVVSLPSAMIKGDVSCSLDMRRYLESEKPGANPAGFPIVKLSDVCSYMNGKTLSSTEKVQDGEYDVMGGGMDYIGKTNKYNRDGETISISKSGASAGFVVYHNKKYWAGDCLTLVTNDDTRMTTRYLYYFMKLNNHLITSKTSGSTIPHCKWDDINGIPIQLPPLPIQEEIVATLDRIYAPGTTELADTLKMTDKAMDLVLANPAGATLEPIVEAQRLIRKSAQMVADVKAQMVAIVKSVKSRGFPLVKLSDVCKVSFGDRITKKDNTGTIYPVYGSGGNTFRTDKSNRTGKTCKVGRFALSEANMVMIVQGPYWLMDSGFTVESKQPETITTEFLWYCLLMDKKRLATLSTGSCQKNIDMDAFYKVEYPCPPIPFQEALISRLDALQSQLTSLEILQKQSEDNARFILESYLGTSSTQIKEIPDEEILASDDGASSTAETTEDENPFPHGLPMESSHSPSDVIGEAAAPAKAEKQTIKITRQPRRKLVVKE
jgi:restriction endonuclease S subunit